MLPTAYLFALYLGSVAVNWDSEFLSGAPHAETNEESKALNKWKLGEMRISVRICVVLLLHCTTRAMIRTEL